MSKQKKKKTARRAVKTVDRKQPFIQKNLVTIVLILVLIFVSAVRLRLLGIPIERDEGEYAYFGQLLLQGIPPFKAAYSMKFPGVYFIYAFFMLIFGQNVEAIHFGLLLTTLTTTVFLFLLVKKLIGETAGLVAATVFAILSMNDSLLGFAGHATHFVILAAVPGIYFLIRAFENQKTGSYLTAGILLGLAPIFKQSGIMFSIFGASLFVVQYFNRKDGGIKKLLRGFGIYVAGGFLMTAVVFLYLLISGVFSNFWFWTFEYPFAYGGQVTLQKGLGYFSENFTNITSGFIPMWILAAAGIPLLFFAKFRMERGFVIPFVLLLFVFSFISIVPGMYFRPHYFISILPSVAVSTAVTTQFLSGIRLAGLSRGIRNALAFILIILFTGIGISQNKNYYFSESPDDISRRIYGLNPFVESEAIGEFIRRNSDKNDKIAVFGSEPQFYFFARRLSATGFIYMYPMMEDHKYNQHMQDQMIGEVEAADPKILVFVDITTSWLKKSESPTEIFSWSMQLVRKGNYELIGTVEIFSDATLYKFTDVAMKNQPESKYRVRIYKKKD